MDRVCVVVFFFTAGSHLQCQNVITEALEMRLESRGEVSTITRHVVGGRIVMQSVISESDSLICQVQF